MSFLLGTFLFAGDGDQVDIEAMAAKGGNQAFKFIGAHDFKHAGDLHFDKGNGFSTLSGGVNGDGKAYFTIHGDIGGVVKNDFDL